MSDLAITGIFIILIVILTLGYNYIITKIEKRRSNLIKRILDRVRQERKEEIENKYNCKNCMHYGNFEAFYGEVYACELYECHYKRKERANEKI